MVQEKFFIPHFEPLRPPGKTHTWFFHGASIGLRNANVASHAMKKACGGVVIDQAGRVLLRQPTGLHKTRLWTFAKGRSEPGETPEQTALREVREETGVVGRIVSRLQVADTPDFRDDFFLMSVVEDTRQFDAETAVVVWATQEEAEELIGMTGDDERRLRDLKMLQAAFAEFNARRPIA
jgi:8-oxo-dGTP diphosphatase